MLIVFYITLFLVLDNGIIIYIVQPLQKYVLCLQWVNLIFNNIVHLMACILRTIPNS